MGYYTHGTVQVKKTLLHLDILRNLLLTQKRIGQPLQKAVDKMIEFEKALAEIQEQNKIIREISFRLQNPYYEYLPENYGGEVLALGGFAGHPKPIAELSSDPTFDPNKIDEMIRLFDALRKLSINGVDISGEEKFDSSKIFFLPPIASTTPDFSLVHENPITNHCPQQIHKVFSDAELDYKLISPEDTGRSLFRNKQYSCSFNTPPSWVINGKVIYEYDGSMNLAGLDSPHTEFNFTAYSLYVDPSQFPTREELLSPNQTKSLSLKLSKEPR